MSAYDDKHFDVESSLPADVTLPEWRHEQHAPMVKAQGHMLLAVLAVFRSKNTVR